MTQSILSRNNVQVFGQGTKTLLFAHGFGCDQNMWRFVTPAFDAEYRIVLFDYVGSGKSDARAYDVQRYGDLSGYAQDVLDICAVLELTDVIFVGHSVSGMIGLLASLQAPERFERLILITPSPCYINDPPDYMGGFERAELEGLFDLMDKNDFGWASFLAPVVMQNPERPDLTAELEGSFCAADPAIMRRFAEVTFFSLIIQCSQDVIAPRSVGEYLHQHLPASALRRIEATGHCPHMSHPAQTAQIIREYLAESGTR